MSKLDKLQKAIEIYYRFSIPLTRKDSWKYAWRQTRKTFLTDRELLKSNTLRFKERYKEEGLDKSLYKKYYRDFLLCYVLFCCTADEYFQYSFYDKNLAWKNHHITIERRIFTYTILNTTDDKNILAYKTRFNEYFKDYIHRRWCGIKSVTETEFINLFSGLDQIIVKPDRNYGGKGIAVFNASEDELLKVYKKYSKRKNNFIVEEYLNQRGILHDINPDSLNTIRITTLRTKKGIEVIDGYYRCGCGDAKVDNFTSGGLIFPINITNGIIYEGHSAIDLHVSVHPVSGIPIEGLKVPDWEMINDSIKKIHESCPDSIAIVGWDIVVIDGNVTLIEGNSMPGYTELFDPNKKLWQTIKHSF